MRIRHLSITVIGLSLAACGGGAEDAVVPAEAQEQAVAAAEQEVAGPERRILAFGDSLFAGYGLDEQQGYPEQLEDTLRARGTNARVIDAGVSGDTSAAGRQRLAFTLDAQDTPPDLVILDWMLPGLDGLEVCKRLRAASDIPILMLTAKDDVQDRVIGLDAGADDYLVKPIDSDHLHNRIEKVFLKKKAASDPF